VSKNASEEEIKKQYKKLAIKFHPDKNRAPQSADAFKKVSAAYACLTDAEKRKMYDLTGEEPGNIQPNMQRGQRFRQSQFEQEIDPQEIFEMFFGGGLFGPNIRHHRQRFAH
jgi:DnaJ family protein B protein 12